MARSLVAMMLMLASLPALGAVTPVATASAAALPLAPAWAVPQTVLDLRTFVLKIDDGDDDGTGTCDFRLVEERRLTAWNDELRQIGVRGDNSLSIAGLALTNWHNLNATFDLETFCTRTREEVPGFVRSHVLPVLNM